MAEFTISHYNLAVTCNNAMNINGVSLLTNRLECQAARAGVWRGCCLCLRSKLSGWKLGKDNKADVLERMPQPPRVREVHRPVKTPFMEGSAKEVGSSVVIIQSWAGQS